MPFAGTLEAVNNAHKQRFNMCGYAAQKVETVRIGIIGIGQRGIGAVHRFRLIEGLEIKALCDLRIERVEAGQKAVTDYGLPAARSYTQGLFTDTHDQRNKRFCSEISASRQDIYRD